MNGPEYTLAVGPALGSLRGQADVREVRSKDPSADRCLALQVASLFVLQPQDRVKGGLAGSSRLAASSESCQPGRLHQPAKEYQLDAITLATSTAPRKLRVTLTAGSAAAAARGEVRAAIRAWNVPVDPSVAVLLTGELVTNALKHEACKAIELVISCAYGQLQVDVYGTSPAEALQAGSPADADAGGELMLLASLASSWGYYRTPAGKAGYFTLMF
jgi:hypothetical protein